MSNEPPKLIGVQELAQALSISTAQVYRLANSGQIPSMRVGNLFRFDLSQVLTTITQNASKTNE